MSTLVWFRQDLRLADNPALAAAAATGEPVIPVYICAPGEESPWGPGSASRWWLHGSLSRLDESLRAIGSALCTSARVRIRSRRSRIWPGNAGRSESFGTGATSRQQRSLARAGGSKAALSEAGLETRGFQRCAAPRGPGRFTSERRTRSRSFHGVQRSTNRAKTRPVTARRRCARRVPGLASPSTVSSSFRRGAGLAGSRPQGPRDATRRMRISKSFWRIASTRGTRRWKARSTGRYGTSRMSPHVHFGEIGPREIWHAARRAALARGQAISWRDSQFLTEIGWREFAYHLLFHFPNTPEQPLRANYGRFPWRSDAVSLRAWQRGTTGYPIVDAGMRELWRTGWMHNRVRMIAGSFLVKDLLLSWTEGARWCAALGAGDRQAAERLAAPSLGGAVPSTRGGRGEPSRRTLPISAGRSWVGRGNRRSSAARLHQVQDNSTKKSKIFADDGGCFCANIAKISAATTPAGHAGGR